MITTRHITVFYTVCKYMNFTKASEELFISQPAVSKTIKDIEDEYGILLFERYNKALYLTPAGSALLEYSKQIVNLLDDLDERLKLQEMKDIIRIGASITIGTSILGEIVSEFCKINNSVKIEAVVDGTAVLEKYLLQGKIDIALLEGRISSSDIHSENVGATDVVLVVNKDHPLYDKEDVCLEDLEGQDFIVREVGSRTREIFAQAMEKNNVHWKASWSCHNTQAIKNVVDEGLGIGVLSKLSVRKRLQSGRFKALNVFEEPLKLYIKSAYLENKYFNQNLLDFKEYAEKHIKIMADEKNQ